MAVTLAALLGTMAAMLWLVRRFGWKLPGQLHHGDRLGVVSRLALDQKHALVLIRRDSKEQLLLLGPAGATVVETEIVLTPADRSLKRRREREEAARIAQAQARAEAMAERMRIVVVRLIEILRSSLARLRRRSAPTFRHFVLRARKRTLVRPNLAPKGRPQRARRTHTRA